MTTLITVRNSYASASCDCPYRRDRLGKRVSQFIESQDSILRDIQPEWSENQTRYGYGQASLLPNYKLVKEGMYLYIRSN